MFLLVCGWLPMSEIPRKIEGVDLEICACVARMILIHIYDV